MIILQKLKWSNCFSYGKDNELDLDSMTLTQIIGTNGTGKSSIPLIIEEALYNKNSKGIKKVDIPNRYMNSGYSIYLSFTKDSSFYEINIFRKSSIKVSLKKDNEDISSHTSTNTYKTIQEIIGLDFKTFSQLVYQSTNASLQFLTATDTNRKKFLIDLLRLENYIKLFEIFKEGHKKANNDKIGIASKVDTVKKWLESNKLSSTNILPIENLEISTTENEEQLRFLTSEIKNISEKNKKIIKNNQYKKLLQSINIQELQNNTATYRDYAALISQSGEYDAEIKREQAVVDKLTKLGQECPTCNQKISYDIKQSMITEAATKVERLDGDRDGIRRRIKSIKFENTEFKRVQDSIKNWEDLYRNVESNLPSDLLDKAELESRLVYVQNDLQEQKREILRVNKLNEERKTHNTRIEVIQEQTEKFEKELKTCKKGLEKVVELESYLETLKKSFSTNGLIAYKIETLVKELETLVNKYLGEFSDGRFTLEFVVSNDKLNVQITDNGNIVDILALSSGELARVNTATLLAIRKLMSSISESRINVLFLDEVINVLDEVGRERLVEVLLKENLNTYIVSHGWTHPLLEKVEVVKEKDVSRLQW